MEIDLEDKKRLKAHWDKYQNERKLYENDPKWMELNEAARTYLLPFWRKIEDMCEDMDERCYWYDEDGNQEGTEAWFECFYIIERTPEYKLARRGFDMLTARAEARRKHLIAVNK